MANGRGSAKHADFIGIERKVANSTAFKTLPPIARALYVDLLRQFNGHNNGQISAVLKGTEKNPGLAAFGWAPRTVFKLLNLLIDHGVIEKTRQGGINYLSKVCTLYAFTHLPVMANKEKGIAGSMPSLTYLAFTPKERTHRTRQKKDVGAHGAYIAARGACTQVHAMPIDHATSACGAASDSGKNEAEPFDDTAVCGTSDANGPGAPTSAPRAHPYNLASGGPATPGPTAPDGGVAPASGDEEASEAHA